MMQLQKTKWNLVLVSALSILLCTTACGGKKKMDPHSPDRAGTQKTMGHLKIGKPYEVAGKQYFPAHDPYYREEGIASWYGPGFDGRPTANGERFDQNAMTAAHRTLPLPSVVRVTNLENGRSAVLKVNDRGPFKSNRIIDLSKKAAQELGVIARGTAQVRVEYLPQESRQLVMRLVRENKLQADEQTLAMLGMLETPEDNQGFALVSSAYASQPQETAYANAGRAITEVAPLPAVSSSDLAPPSSANMAGQGGTQLSSLEPSAARVLTDAPIHNDPLFPPADLPGGMQQQAPAPMPATAGVTPAAVTTEQGVFVQAGAFGTPENAHELAERLASVGRTAVKPVEVNGRMWYRVRLGPLPDRATADYALKQVHGMGLQDARVVQD